MKKLRTLLFAMLAAFACGEAVCAEYYVCIGSYADEELARAHAEIFNNGGLAVFISEHQGEDGKFAYRILWNNPFSKWSDSKQRIGEVKKFEIVKKMKVGNFWCCESDGAKVAVGGAEPIVPQHDRFFITVKDGGNGKPVGGANVKIDEKWNRVTEDDGRAFLPGDLTEGEHSILITKSDEYVQTSATLTISGGVPQAPTQFSIPKKASFDEIKIVLEWGEFPTDLDACLVDVAAGKVISWSNRENGPVSLDRDCASGFGPETMTISAANPTSTYSFFVWNCDGQHVQQSLSNSGAKVTVYVANKQKATFSIPRGKDGNAWYVFDIIRGGEILKKNVVRTESTAPAVKPARSASNP